MSALKQHMPVHTGEKKFECKTCARRFTQSSSLYKHMKKSIQCAGAGRSPVSTSNALPLQHFQPQGGPGEFRAGEWLKLPL